ncbi:MAG: hypothetical protein PHS14_06580 [Elusimicrobia bacterium]|nr:hypothetical protein [Elusimicrobiota bacterium]
MAMKRLGFGLFLGFVLVWAGFAGAKDAKGGKAVNMFMGNYGYVLEFPTTYTALPSFDDPEKTMERVLIYPKGTPAAKMDEKNYGKYGIMRVEVAPIMARTPRGTFRAGLKELTVIIPAALKENGETCVVTKFASPFPAAKFTISGGIPVVQVVLEGAKVTYIFTAAKDDAPLRNLIKSLKEIAPTDKPGL